MNTIILVLTAMGAAGVQPTAHSQPLPRHHHGLAYDPGSQRVLVFGGFHTPSAGRGHALDDLWSWDGRQWTAIAPTTGIPAAGHAFFTDGTGGLFMFGGNRGLTGKWDGRQWSIIDEDSTRRLAAPAGAYDSRRRRYVMFGGSVRAGSVVGDTWEFDGTRWVRVATEGPPAMMAGSMVYDERRGVTVLFGGVNSASPRQWFGETWEWDGTRWMRVATSGPPARSGAGMVYDSKRNLTIVFGGGGADRSDLDDTWLWNGQTWRRADVKGPPARNDALMAFDASRGVAVMYGGVGRVGGSYGDLWEWDGQVWWDPLESTCRHASLSIL